MSAYPGILKITVEAGSCFFEFMEKQQRIRWNISRGVIVVSVKQGKQVTNTRGISAVLEQGKKVFPLHGFDPCGNEMFRDPVESCLPLLRIQEQFSNREKGTFLQSASGPLCLCIISSQGMDPVFPQLDADGGIAYGTVVKVMDLCRDGGAEMIGVIPDSIGAGSF